MKHILVFITLITIIGCSQPAAYNVYEPIEENGWHSDAPILFKVDTLAPGTYCNVLHIRMPKHSDYPYQELALEVERTWQDIIPKSVDTLILKFNEHNTQPTTQGIHLIDHAFTIDTTTCTSPHLSTVVVRHLMHPPLIKGIVAIGLEVRQI